jgi:FtsH-binding integral membrane protein
MFCANCGNKINYNGNFCESCGAELPSQAKTGEESIAPQSLNETSGVLALNSDQPFVADLDANQQLQFYKKIYIHLASYVVIFALLSKTLFDVGFGYFILRILGESRFFWLAIMGGFWISSRISDHFSEKLVPNLSYIGPIIAIAAESIVFAPLFAYADYYHDGAIENATYASLLIVSSLIAAVHLTKTNFEPLGLFLKLGSIIALGFIVASVIFDFSLGMAFAWAMLALATGYILYDTSQIVRVYKPEQHILASTRLLGSALFFFYYVLRIFSSDDD